MSHTHVCSLSLHQPMSAWLLPPINTTMIVMPTHELLDSLQATLSFHPCFMLYQVNSAYRTNVLYMCMITDHIASLFSAPHPIISGDQRRCTLTAPVQVYSQRQLIFCPSSQYVYHALALHQWQFLTAAIFSHLTGLNNSAVSDTLRPGSLLCSVIHHPNNIYIVLVFSHLLAQSQ